MSKFCGSHLSKSGKILHCTLVFLGSDSLFEPVSNNAMLYGAVDLVEKFYTLPVGAEYRVDRVIQKNKAGKVIQILELELSDEDEKPDWDTWDAECRRRR